MVDHDMRKCQSPALLDQKSNQIVVGDTVNVRYDNTSNYWPVKVLDIDDRNMTVQWDDPQDQHSTVTIPHASVLALGADGVYADDCSAQAGA